MGISRQRLWLLLPALLLSGGCVRVQIPTARIVPGETMQPDGLAWAQAVDMALSRHPDLRQARETLSAKAHNRNQAFGAYLPSVDGTVSRKRVRDGGSATTTDSLDLDVSQPIFSGFQTTGAALQAWREWEAARWAYVEASAQVRQSLRNAFVELLRLDQLVQVDRRIAARRQDNADLLRLRYEAGRENEGSQRRAQAIAQQAAFDVRQVERRIESQSLALGRQLGGYFAVPMRVAGTLDELLPEKAGAPADYVALAEATPSVQRLTRNAEALKAAIISSQGKLWPTVEGTLNRGGSGSKFSDVNSDTTIGVTVSVPLFHGGQNVEGLLESNAAYHAAVEAARSERDRLVATLGDRWAVFQDARELIVVRQAFLDAARQRAEIVHSQYTSGLANFQDFDIAEQELADSEKTYVQSLADVLTREADWVAATGGTLEEARNGR